jgi:hypothetical protein
MPDELRNDAKTINPDIDEKTPEVVMKRSWIFQPKYVGIPVTEIFKH